MEWKNTKTYYWKQTKNRLKIRPKEDEIDSKQSSKQKNPGQPKIWPRLSRDFMFFLPLFYVINSLYLHQPLCIVFLWCDNISSIFCYDHNFFSACFVNLVHNIKKDRAGGGGLIHLRKWKWEFRPEIITRGRVRQNLCINSIGYIHTTKFCHPHIIWLACFCVLFVWCPKFKKRAETTTWKPRKLPKTEWKRVWFIVVIQAGPAREHWHQINKNLIVNKQAKDLVSRDMLVVLLNEIRRPPKISPKIRTSEPELTWK